ncbi:hypothetical protein Sjap_017682 [Stephania japonica]|uniref:Uncharacterized protein n=1 Tax=Stephania japonica TaxID=461633 RepID=A0AAP0I6L4_9MAGN
MTLEAQSELHTPKLVLIKQKPTQTKNRLKKKCWRSKESIKEKNKELIKKLEEKVLKVQRIDQRKNKDSIKISKEKVLEEQGFHLEINVAPSKSLTSADLEEGDRWKNFNNQVIPSYLLISRVDLFFKISFNRTSSPPLSKKQ